MITLLLEILHQINNLSIKCFYPGIILMRGDEVILNISISSIPHLSAQCLPNLTRAVKEIWVFISEFLLFPTKTKATNPSIASSGVELEFSYVRVISCLEQMGHSCLLMSLR